MYKIGIVDDHDLIREAITLMTNSFTNDKYQLIYSVTLRASNGNDLMYQLLDPVKPDVILLDINMPKMDRFASLKWVKENYPEIKVLMLTMMESHDSIIKSLKLGARDTC